MRIALLAFIFAIATPVMGQTKATITAPPGDVVVFATKGLATSAPSDPTVPKDGVAELIVNSEDTLYVWDKTGNRIAHTAVAPTWGPKLEDLKDVAQVTVDLQHDGKPVAAANVTLDDGRQKKNVLVDPSSKGSATFFDVKAGSLKVTVTYRAAGKDATPVTQIFEAKANGDPVPHFLMALPEAVEIIGPPPAAPGVKGDPSAPGAVGAPGTPASQGSQGFNFVGTLFALVIGGAAAAGIWFYIKKNPEMVGGTLEKLGAQIPKPGDAPLADPPVPAAPAAVPAAPPQKIVLDAGPDPIAISSAPAPISLSAPAGGYGEPSLVSESGIAIPVAEGETVVGREVGLGLSLAGESTVSRRHAVVVRNGSTVVVQDEGSTNGTFVNGSPVTGSVALNPGDSVQFGSVRFRYEG